MFSDPEGRGHRPAFALVRNDAATRGRPLFAAELGPSSQVRYAQLSPIVRLSSDLALNEKKDELRRIILSPGHLLAENAN